MEQYLGLSTYPLDSPESIIFASLCLEGNLALWWEHSCRQADSPTAGFQSWTAFREALLAHLCPPSARPVAMQKMRELQQGRDSVSVFASKFLSLLTDLPDWGQDQKIDEFMAKANPDLTLPFAFMPHQPTTLEETIRMLSYYEQQQKQQRIVVKNYNKQAANNRYTTTSASTSYGHRDYSSTRAEPSTSEPMDIGTVRHRVMTIIEGTKTRYPRPDTPRRSSHSSRSASTFRSSSRATTPGRDRLANTTTRRSKLTQEQREELRANDGCLYCRQPHAGHIAANCPHLPSKK